VTTVEGPNGVNSNLFLAVFNPTQNFFGLLQALKDEDLVKIMAKPNLVSLSGRPAQFLDGGEQAIPVPAGLGQVGVEFVEFGTRLSFLPIVLGNGKIYLEVEPEVSSLDPAFGTSINGTVVPGRDTQRVHTTVQLEDGQTYVLGGLIQHRVIGTTTKVPVVGEIPFLGAAFSRKIYTEEEDELVILVTPHLVDGMSCDQAPKLLPGDETRSPDDFELFLEGILEAPRGSREVCPDYRYVPAYKNGPTSALFPCAGNGNGGGGAGCAAAATAGTAAHVAGSASLTGSAVPTQAKDAEPPATTVGSVAVPETNISKPTPLPPEVTVTGDSGGKQ
jgi:pilus assembly protein CpaC